MDRLWLKSGLIVFKAEQQHMSAVKSSCLIWTCNSCKACENQPKAKKKKKSNKEPSLIQRMFLKEKEEKIYESFQSCDWQVVKNKKLRGKGAFKACCECVLRMKCGPRNSQLYNSTTPFGKKKVQFKKSQRWTLSQGANKVDFLVRRTLNPFLCATNTAELKAGREACCCCCCCLKYS